MKKPVGGAVVVVVRLPLELTWGREAAMAKSTTGTLHAIHFSIALVLSVWFLLPSHRDFADVASLRRWRWAYPGSVCFKTPAISKYRRGEDLNTIRPPKNKHEDINFQHPILPRFLCNQSPTSPLLLIRTDCSIS